MYLNEYINQCNFTKIWTKLISIYPDQKENKDKYKKVFQQLENMEPDYTKKLDLVIKKEYEPEGEMYYTIRAFSVNHKENYNISFLSWEKWLGLNITNDLDLENEEILAHIIWEMTFYGFDEKTIRKQAKVLLEQIAPV